MADEFECVLAGPETNAFPITGKVEFFDLGTVTVSEGDVDEAYGFVCVRTWCAWAGAGDPGDRDAERGAGASADTFGERLRDFGRDWALFSDERCRDIGEGGFQGVAVDYRASEKIARASGNRGETLGEQTAGAAFRGCEGEAA